MPITAVTESDVIHALIYAAQSRQFTYDRMDEGESREDKLVRFRRIRDGAIGELAVERILNQQYGISTASALFKTDWRSRDRMDLVLFARRSRMIDVDVKCHRVHDRNVVIDEIKRKGEPLVPKSQFEDDPKPWYIFAYLLLKDERHGFTFTETPSSIAQIRCYEPRPYGSEISIGVAKFSAETGTSTQIVQCRTSAIEGVKERYPGEIFVDAVFAFSEQVRRIPMTLTTARGRHFVVRPSDWLFGNIGVSIEDSFVYLAGWATRSDVERWDTRYPDNPAFPYQTTHTVNLVGNVSQLRPMSELQELCNRSRGQHPRLVTGPTDA